MLDTALQLNHFETRCHISGALAKAEYEQILEQRSFEDVSVEVTNVHDPKIMGRLSDQRRL